MERVFVNGEHSSAIMKSMTRLWKERKYCDAVLEINSETVELHKLVLLAASPSIIDKVNDITERGTIVIKLDGDKYSKEAVKLCVQYLYKGVAKLTDTNVKSIARVAQALDIKEILKICSSFQDTFKLVKDENSTDNSDTEIESYSEDPEQLQENLSTALQEALDNIKEIEENAKDDNTNMETQVEIQAEHEQITEINPLAIDSEPVAYDVKNEVESEKEEEIDMGNDDIAEKEVASAKDKINRHKYGRVQPELESTSDKLLECPRCDLKIKGSDNLMSHISSYHILKKKFTCLICAKIYSSKQARENHKQSIHTSQCRKCSRFVIESVPWSKGMDRRSSRTVRCKCGSNVTVCTRFSRSKEHSGDMADAYSAKKNVQEKYACVTCGKLFLTKTHCQRHSMTHNDDKVFSCSRCDSRFSHQSALKKHEVDAHDVKSLVCSYCAKTFSRLITLKTHLVKKHSTPAYGKSSGK